MKRILILIILLFATPAFADYTVELKNEGGTIIKTYIITSNQVMHLQKSAILKGVSVLDQFEFAIICLIRNAKAYNRAIWEEDNESYIEEQSRQ